VSLSDNNKVTVMSFASKNPAEMDTQQLSDSKVQQVGKKTDGNQQIGRKPVGEQKTPKNDE
jgi:hypothetical protein